MGICSVSRAVFLLGRTDVPLTELTLPLALAAHAKRTDRTPFPGHTPPLFSVATPVLDRVEPLVAAMAKLPSAYLR